MNSSDFENPKLQAIVHIGTEKTGTTSIQTYLQRNREILIKHGYYFTQSAGIENNRAVPGCCVSPEKNDEFFRKNGAHSLEERIALQQFFILKIHEELSSLPDHIHTIIISSEHLQSRLITLDEIKRVKEIFDPYVSEYKIVCYLREQSACCTSRYTTVLKSGRPESLEELSQHCTESSIYYNYYNLLNRWSKVFGRDNMSVSLFDPKSFLNKNLLDDFTAKIDTKLIGCLVYPPLENESLNYSGQIIAKAISRAFPKYNEDKTFNLQREKCEVIISQQMTGRGKQLSLEQSLKIYHAFFNSNELLRREYFPDLDVLFPQPTEPKLSDNATDEEWVDILSQLFSEIASH